MPDRSLLRQRVAAEIEEPPRRANRPDHAQAWSRWKTGAGVAVVGVGVACLAWPRTGPLLAGRLDPDWVFALQYFAARRSSGHLFTFGPLGFLAADRLFTGAGSLALVAKGAMWLSVSWLALRSIPDRIGGAWRLGIAALLFLAFAPVFVASWITVVGPAAIWWALLYIDGRVARHGSPIVLGSAMGVLGGLVLLTKAGAGILVILTLVAALAGRAWVDKEGSARLSRIAGSGIAGLVGLLLIAPALLGWVPADLQDWGRGSYELVTGYAGAMGSPEPITLEGWIVLTLLAASIGLAAACARSRREAVTIVAVTSLAGWLTVLSEYVRARQPVATYALIIAISVAAPVGRLARDRLGHLLARAALIAAAATGLLLAASGSYGFPINGPISHVAAAAQDARLVALPSARDEFIERQRVQFRETLFLSPEIVRELSECTAHAIPVDAGLFYAYPELEWRPPPVFQDYAAYTSWLDDTNAAFYRSDRAPGCIVRRVAVDADGRASSIAIDSRAARFESPETQIVLTCRYEVVDFDGIFELLRQTENQCGEIDPGEVTTAHYGALIDVPTRPDSLTVARFDLPSDSLRDRAVALAWRPGRLFVSDGQTSYRFLPGHARAWHLLRAPDCPDAFLPMAANPQFEQLSLATSPTASRSEKTYEIQYGFVPYRCPAP